jgi:flagellar basal-body rod modification protein FlgD
METATISPSFSATASVQATDPLGSLATDDFFNLLITQLTNQDPLEPTGNEELLQQIASIRDIELSTSLTESLSRLSGNQQFASAASLIGKYVKSIPDDSGVIKAGIAVGVRFDTEGEPILQLSDGGELPLNQVATIEPPTGVAERLMGTNVTGLNAADPTSTVPVQGIVTGVRLGETGEVLLELDTGETMRFRDVVGQSAPAA